MIYSPPSLFQKWPDCENINYKKHQKPNPIQPPPKNTTTKNQLKPQPEAEHEQGKLQFK